MTSQEVLFIQQEHQGLRLDKVLAIHYPLLSRTYFQSLIEKGSILVNGLALKKREKLSEGDEIEICFELVSELALEPENIPLDICFEDEHLLVVNKPSGMVVHPSLGHPKSTFVNALLFHCKSLPEEGRENLRPGIVHRLDKDTTGLLIAAKSSLAHRALVKQFSERKIKKSYLAVVTGCPREGRLEAPLKRHPTLRQQMTVDPEGKEAISIITHLAKTPHLSLVQVELITGRTHQIRAHMKHLQAPVLGDSVYGSDSQGKKYGAQRQYLHAHTIAFTHPVTSELIELTSTPPEDMKNFIAHHFKINF